ncbi:MAG: Ig-like domain-containing protein, partial [Muribaculaceae bacterium]|nr:Ig-like domain-containing protein [Muribaculaceae bacterium]
MVKKRFLLMMLLAVLCAASSTAQMFKVNRQQLRLEGSFIQMEPVSSQTYMYMDDFTITPGETKTVTVYLHSVQPIWMLQVYFNLPDGLTAKNPAMTSSFKAITNNGNGFSIMSGYVDGQYRVVLSNYGKEDSIPIVDAQSVFTMQVTAASDMAAGEYVLSTSDFKFVAATTDIGEGYWGTNTSCQVTVTEPLATAISLNQQSLSMLLGSSQTLTATISPSTALQTVNWSSSNTSVATVTSAGKVN